MTVMAPAVLALAMLLAPATVEGHGWLQKPLARQFCNTNELKWAVTTSAGNGAKGMGGVGLLKLGGVPGLCGDPFEGKDDEPASNFKALPCQPQENYEEGGILKTEVDIIANHGGFWEMSVCDKEDISQDCFDKNKLKTVDNNSEQWHILKTTIEDPDVRNPEKYVMEWRLPAGLTCEHCVVQWSWWTATHCVYPCKKEICGFYADRLNKIVRPTGTHPMDFCPSMYPKKDQKPQMFRNCADISIGGGGNSASTMDSSSEPNTETVTTMEPDTSDDQDDMSIEEEEEEDDDEPEPEPEQTSGATASGSASASGSAATTSVSADTEISSGDGGSANDFSDLLRLEEKALFVEEEDGEPEKQSDVAPKEDKDSNGCGAEPGYYCGPGGRIRKIKNRERKSKDRTRGSKDRTRRFMSL